MTHIVYREFYPGDARVSSALTDIFNEINAKSAALTKGNFKAEGLDYLNLSGPIHASHQSVGHGSGTATSLTHAAYTVFTTIVTSGTPIELTYAPLVVTANQQVIIYAHVGLWTASGDPALPVDDTKLNIKLYYDDGSAHAMAGTKAWAAIPSAGLGLDGIGGGTLRTFAILDGPLSLSKIQLRAKVDGTGPAKIDSVYLYAYVAKLGGS